MSEQVSIARTARERLAAGLAALQDPGAPESLTIVAEPIAKAMSAMHRIERGDTGRDTAPEALRLVREALAQLQSSQETHPALDAAMENVAQSLSAVHALARAAMQQPAPPEPEAAKTTPSPPLDPHSLSPQANVSARPSVPRPQAYTPVAHTAPVAAVNPLQQAAAPGAQTKGLGKGSTQPVVPIQVPATIADSAIPLNKPANPYTTQPIAKARTAPQVQMEVSPKTEPRPLDAPSPAKTGLAQPEALPAQPQVVPQPQVHQQPAPPQAVAQAAPQQAASAPVVAAQPVPQAAPREAAVVNPVLVREPQPRAISEKPEVGSSPSNPTNRSATYDVALGTNSNSNFYKGLSPGDLLESGGLFIATYNIPDLGARVDLKVTMPGGYEFAAEGIVAWTRDTPPASNNANLSPPGFGVRLKLTSSEARALVHRYARNREPFFYDDI